MWRPTFNAAYACQEHWARARWSVRQHHTALTPWPHVKGLQPDQLSWNLSTAGVRGAKLKPKQTTTIKTKTNILPI